MNLTLLLVVKTKVKLFMTMIYLLIRKLKYIWW